LDPHLSQCDVLFGFLYYFPAFAQKVPSAPEYMAPLVMLSVVFTIGWT